MPTTTTMTSKQRVLAALNFRKPDRVPRFWPSFWPEFTDQWRQRLGATDLHEHFGDDIRLVDADEAAWPSKAGIVKHEANGMAIIRTAWGDLKRAKASDAAPQLMGELIEPAISQRVDPDTLIFDDPKLDSRYEEAGRLAEQYKDRYFVFCKTGGPYLRAAFMRGEENLWMDVAEDPQWAKAFVDRITDHLTQVGLEQLRRYDLYDTGIGIYDDVAASWGPFVGPANYERIFLPALRKMVQAYKDAGAACVMHHSDGNVLSLLDMWIDAGVQAINPVEFRTGMDPVKIRQQYGTKLVCVGGLDNSDILPRGDKKEIRDHVLHLMTANQDGGYIIGPHSIGPDISIQTMEYVFELLETGG